MKETCGKQERSPTLLLELARERTSKHERVGVKGESRKERETKSKSRGETQSVYVGSCSSVAVTKTPKGSA